MKKTFSKEVNAVGHLIDSGIMTDIFDTIIRHKGQFKVHEFKVGTTNVEASTVRMTVTADTQQHLDKILNDLNLLGCAPVELKEINLKQAEADRVVPNEFYSTTNHTTEVYYKGKWLKVKDQRMDAVIVVKDGKAGCVKLRDVKKGDMVVCGLAGVKVIPVFKERDRQNFVFMDTEVSSEKKVEIKVKALANIMRDVKAKKGKIVVVTGPVVVHTGGIEGLIKLIRKGFVDVLLGGNAIAVHDIENALYGTSLGVSTTDGQPVDHGHKNHMRAINEINRAGSIKKAVEKGVLKSGIMYECVKNKVPFVLAGSLRDDGPLPETEMNLINAQAQYSDAIKDADLVLMLSSMLHSIGTGNMMRSNIRTFCVDINPAVVTKLADRGSSQAVGIVTDVGLFLQLLGKEF